MSKKTADRVFVIKDGMSRIYAHVIARHGKGALTVARQMVRDLPVSAMAFETTAEKAALAINAKAARP